MWYLVLIEWVQQVHGLAKHNMQHHLWSQEDLLRVIQKAVLRKRKHANVPQYPKCLRHGTTYVYSRKHKLCSLTHNCREVGHTTFFSWRITSYFTTQSMSSDTTNTLHNTNTTCIVAWHTTCPTAQNICLKAQNMFPKAHSSKYHPGCCEKASMQGWSLPFFPILSYSFLSLLPFFPFFLPSFLPSCLLFPAFLLCDVSHFVLCCCHCSSR